MESDLRLARREKKSILRNKKIKQNKISPIMKVKRVLCDNER